MYRVIHHHDFWIKSCETSLFICAIFLFRCEISERKSKDNNVYVYHRKTEVFFLFILLLNFSFWCSTSALQSRHTFPVNSFFFHQVVGKTFFVKYLYACGWNQFLSIPNCLKYFRLFFSNRLFGEICLLNIIISFTEMSNSCWKVMAVWLRMTIFLRWIEWNCYVSFWTLGCGWAAHKGFTERVGWIRNDRE